MHAQYSCACCDSDARLSKASRLAGGRVRCIHSLQEDSDAEREAAIVALVEPLAVLEPARSNREGRVRVGRGASEGRVRDEWVRRPDRCAWGDGWRAHCCRQDVASSELTLGVHSFRLLCAPISSISFSSLASISSSCAGGVTARGLLLALVEVGAQVDELVRPQVDDAVVHLLVVVLAALLGHLWPAEGVGS